MSPRPYLVITLAALCACGSQKQSGTNPLDGGGKPPPDGGTIEPGLAFQPAFHQALRWSEPLAGPTTVRMRIPLGRAGERVRVTFKAGEGGMELSRATIARAGAEGSLASDPMELRFDGRAGFSASPRAQVTSDAVELPVAFREEIAVTFVASGSVAASAVELFPDSYWGSGDQADAPGAFGEPQLRAMGVSNVYVEAPPTRAFVVMGDSITEGYVEGQDEYLEAWPAVAEAALRLPVGNSGVSGQGVDGELDNLESEIFSVEGITDCIVLLGTNDLGGTPAGRIEQTLDLLYDRLRPFCRVWAGTLPPKEMDELDDDRAHVNAWIRGHRRVDGVIDFEAALAEPGNVNRFREGMAMDHVHPSVKGHAAMGKEVVRVIRAEEAADEGPSP